jgi:hypothetical protein
VPSGIVSIGEKNGIIYALTLELVYNQNLMTYLTRAKFYRSLDGGSLWTKQYQEDNNGPFSTGNSDKPIFIHIDGNNYIYINDYISTNQGLSWTDINPQIISGGLLGVKVFEDQSFYGTKPTPIPGTNYLEQSELGFVMVL